MDPQYIEKIRQWVLFDNEIIRNKETINEVVEKKKSIEDEILTYVSKNKNLESITVNISDGYIKFSTTKTKSTITLKSLATILNKYSDDVAQLDVPEIISFINDNLEVKSKTSIRREIKQT